MSNSATTINYGLNDKPPLLTNIFLGVQHVIMLTSMFVFPILLVAAANADMAVAMKMIQASMLVMGVGTLILSSKNRFLGSGYLASPLNDPSFFPVSLAAVKLGGLPLLYTINYIQSVLQAGLAFIYADLRKYFPIEITGLVVLMIGISIINIGISNAVGGAAHLEDLHWDLASLLISLSTLFVMIIFSVWGGKKFLKYALIIGIIWGCSIAVVTHELVLSKQVFAPDHWFSLPSIVGIHLGNFNFDILIPMIVAVIAVTLKSAGGIITAQKINDPKWARVDPVSVRRGIMGTAVISLFAAILGAMPVGVSSINMGLEVTTGCTSRAIAWSIGIIMIVLSFFPAASMIFVLLPKPVLGAMLLYVISSLIVTGIQIMMSRMMNARRLYMIGIPIIMSLTFEFIPQLQRDMPEILRMLVVSPLTSATILALLINFIFLIGSTKKLALQVDISTPFAAQIHTAMHAFGSEIGAVPEGIRKSTKAITDCLYALKNQGIENNKVQIKLQHDDYNLSCQIIYQGAPLNLDTSIIKETFTAKEKIHDVAISSLKSHVDSIKISTQGKEQELFFVIQQ